MRPFVPTIASDTIKTDESGLNWESLTDKERKTLVAMLVAKSDIEALKLAPVGKTQFYAHKKKLEPYRQQLINGLLGKALEVLQANSIKAAETLTEMLNSPNVQTRRAAAESVLDRSVGKPHTTEQQQPIKSLQPLIMIGVPQEKLARLFIPKKYEDLVDKAQEGEIVEGGMELKVENI